MKGLKCGLLLALPIMLGLSLSGFSDTNALSYPIDSIDFRSGDIYTFRKLYDSFSNSDVYTYFINHPNFSVDLVSTPSGFTFPHNFQFQGSYDSSSNTCTLYNQSYYYWDGVGVSTSSDDIVTYYNSSSLPHFEAWSVLGLNSPFNNFQSQVIINSGDFLDSNSVLSPLCNIWDFDYSEDSHLNPFNSSFSPIWNFSSLNNIPLVNNMLAYRENPPYTYAFDGIPINGSVYEDGVLSTKDGISTTDLFKVNTAPYIRSLNFSVNPFTAPNLSINDDSEYSYDIYQFYIEGTLDFDSSFQLNSDSYFTMSVTNNSVSNFSTENNVDGNNIYLNGKTIYSIEHFGYETYDLECDISENHIDNYLTFKCSYNPSLDGGISPLIDFRFVQIDFHFGTLGNSSFVTTSGDFVLKDLNIVTNNNSTPSGFSSTDSISGGHVSSSPNNDGQGTNPDFSWSLQNLFSFNVLNPFSPIFNLFTSNSCVSIPILSGMLNAEETEYCSWFSSNTRGIVTPVLGFASVMLVFGFFVRWLGSSSGNFFEDSRGEEVSNQGGRWGHFKRGGK